MTPKRGLAAERTTRMRGWVLREGRAAILRGYEDRARCWAGGARPIRLQDEDGCPGSSSHAHGDRERPH